MKKITLISLLLAGIFIFGCSQNGDNNQIDTEVDTQITNSGFSSLSDKVQKYKFSWKMEKPSSKEIKNLNYFWDWFHETWNKKVWKEVLEVEWWDFSECEEITLFDMNWTFEKQVSMDQIKKGDIELSWKYDWYGLGFQLDDNQLKFLDKHWWIVFNPWDRRNLWSSEFWVLEQEERWLYYQMIWWNKLPYQRYPYHTVLITSDMLLHFYHKIFSNSLRYYEESVARNTMQNLSEKMFSKFVDLYQTNKNKELTPYYAFSVAYWAIPYSILVPQNIIETAIEEKMNNQDFYWWNMWKDIETEDLHNIILARLDTIQDKIPAEYQSAVKSALNEVLKATSNRAEDPMLSALGLNVDKKIFIEQDYTQFTPRWHYTDSSLLKTYFMGMKRFMREKLYFRDIEQAKISLIMINNIKDDELSNFNKLYDFIGKLIWQDDDVNVNDIQSYIKKNSWNTDKDIVAWINETHQEELQKLKPQKIISTHYKTETRWEVTESQAKDETAWFVFFGEKFTIDSFIFDKMTAGSAEVEFAYKPNLQTTFIVPDALINTGIIRDVVDLWMERAKTKYNVQQEQIDWYNQAKSEITNELNEFDFNISTYHQWLDSLSWLFALTDPNLPYFMQDPLYQYKELNTFQWNYSELKHDTILYVKQAYAELWWGWEDECSIMITPPDLPIPKWYVEPNIDLIDSILKLTNDTKDFFSNDEAYLEYAKFLLFVRDIAIKQSQNELISDEDFEKLRLYYDDIINILYPKKVMDWDNDFISALIADIFTSENNGPLYIATWRPYLMIINVKDANWARAVVWPVYSTYEFYDSDEPIAREQWRYTDDDRQKWYDTLNHKAIYTIPMEKLLEHK